MPREMFGDVVDPSIKVGGQKWYTVPLSIIVHTVLIAAVIIIPLMAADALPEVEQIDAAVVKDDEDRKDRGRVVRAGSARAGQGRAAGLRDVLDLDDGKPRRRGLGRRCAKRDEGECQGGDGVRQVHGGVLQACVRRACATG